MAVLVTPSRITATLSLAAALWMLTSCQVVDPLLASDKYSVQAPGHQEIKVEFEGGTKNVSIVKQQDVIQDLLLDLSRDPARHSLAFDAMLELEDLYQRSGYPLAQIDHTVTTKPDTKVVFTIDQGPRVIVKDLVIKGNKSIPDEVLLAYWSRQQTQSFGFGDNLFVAEDLNSLARDIDGHYQRLGFLDVEVKRWSVTPALRVNTREVTVTIQVVENKPYTVNSFTIDDAVKRWMLRDPIPPPKPGSPFIAQQIRDYALALAQHLRRHGHADPEILTTIDTDRDSGTVKMRIHGTVGPVVEVSRVDIVGLGYVSDGNARKRLELLPGMVFDGKREEDSVLRLYRSGFFKRVQVKHIPDGDGKIIVAFEVEETERYLIQPLVGWGSYEEARAGLEFEMLSLFGSGFDLSAKGTVSNKGYRLVTTISDSEFWPELLDFDTTLSISADAFRREEPSYTDGAVGISPALSHMFSREVSGRVAYIYREHSDATSSVIDPGAMIGDYVEGSTLAELTWDSRDNPLIPQRGSRVALQYKYYDEALGGDVSFERTRLTASHIFPITDSTQFVMHAEVAWLTPKDGSDAIPIQERFFNGGDDTVRSFREDQLAPSNLKDVNGQVVGGEFHNIINLEYRYALPAWQSIGMELSLFADAGNLGRNSDDYGVSDMKYGVGGGLRFLLPIGPVRFDAGYNPDREFGERSWTLHFSIGYPF